MNRRRMMLMTQQKAVDLLEGYRIDNTGSYKINAVWLDNDTLRFYHTSKGFMGPNSASINFIGTTKSQSTGWSGALQTPAMPNLEIGKSYRLTLTVTEIVQNTATAEVDGTLNMAFGKGGGSSSSYATSVDVNFSTLKVGDSFELVKAYTSSKLYIAGAALSAINSNLIWDIKFDVKLEEV